MGQNLITKLRLKLVVVAVGIAALGFSPLPSNAKLERGATAYSYERRIWNEAYHGDSEVSYWANKMLDNYIEELKKLGYPEEEDGFMDFDSVLEYRKKLDELIDLLNGRLVELRSTSDDGNQWADVLPDAIMVYIGPSVVKAVGLGAAFAFRIGLLCIPQRVTRIKNATSEIEKTYYKIDDCAIVAWPQAGIALGAGAGASGGIGVVLFWNFRGDLETPEDIKTSVGLDAEVTISAGVGISLSSGALFNFALSAKPNLFYVEAEWNKGAKLEATFKINGQLLLSPASTRRLLQNFQIGEESKFIYYGVGGGGHIPPGGGPNNPRLPQGDGTQCPPGYICQPGKRPVPRGGWPQQQPLPPGQQPPSGQQGDPPPGDGYPYIGDKTPSRTFIRANPRKDFYKNRDGD